MDNRSIIIFEGPDGAGKSTAVRELVSYTDNYHVVHHGPYPDVTRYLARLYVESMMPAVLGHATTILDRSWLSEPIYGSAYREGEDRIGDVNRRHLERLALGCDTIVVLCLPPWETVLENYRQRLRPEMLETEDQLKLVYELYTRLAEHTDLPVKVYDYTQTTLRQARRGWYSWMGHTDISLNPDHHAAGNLEAEVLLVGDEFGKHKNGDPLYQWPFASLSGSGCGVWLTTQLIKAEIPERKLCWVNSDKLNVFNDEIPVSSFFNHVVALGEKAHTRLSELNLKHTTFGHPQFHKRFLHGDPYPLITFLKEVL